MNDRKFDQIISTYNEIIHICKTGCLLKSIVKTLRRNMLTVFENTGAFYSKNSDTGNTHCKNFAKLSGINYPSDVVVRLF